jgi:hypothetical protein
MLFSGNIFRVSTTINEAGVPIGSIECIDAFYTTEVTVPNSTDTLVKNCPRNWAQVVLLKVSEIVKNICLELIDYEISLGKDSDKLYSYTDTVVQDSQTDWDFSYFSY